MMENRLEPAPTMRVWITEFAVTYTTAAAPFAQLPALVKHKPHDLIDGLPFTVQLHPECRYIRIYSEVQCAFSTTGVATADDIPLPKEWPEFYGITDEKTLSVIATP